MTGHTNTLKKFSLTLLCIGAIGACSKTDRTASADTAAARTDSAAGRLDSAGSMMANKMDSTHAGMNNNTTGPWSNDKFFGYAHNADNGEIALGKLASTKATNPAVKAYGKEMMADHQMMMKQTHTLMASLKAGLDSTWDDAKSIASDGTDKLKELTDKAAGADWDKNYIENQIDAHQRILSKLTDAAKNNTDKTVTDALAKATSKVQEHLTKAQALNEKLKG